MLIQLYALLICKAQGDVCFQTFVYEPLLHDCLAFLEGRGLACMEFVESYPPIHVCDDSPNLLILPLPYTDCTFAVQVCTTQAAAAAVEHEHQRQVSPCSPLF